MAEKKHPQVDPDFQNLFLKSPAGPKVLGMMLVNCNFFGIAETAEQQGAQNYMKLVLSWTGIGWGMPGDRYIRALAGSKVQSALDPNVEVEKES